MDPIITFDRVADYNAFNNNDTLHPLVNVVDFARAAPRRQYKMHFGLYCIVLKQVKCGDIKYGNNAYDYQDGTLVFFAPGQVAAVTSKEYYQPSGMALVFHPDLLHGTALGKHMSDYSFFSYDTYEALHLSEKELKMVTDCFDKIAYELQQAIDKHSKKLIVSNIELFLNYCSRFYDRQFITRDHVHKGVLEKFEQLLQDYFRSDKPQLNGLPTVAWSADQLHLSANYFGDLIKKETGKSAQEYIQSKIIEVAKERIFDDRKSVSEIAYELGFRYPQHFTRLFKQRVGHTPNAYKFLNGMDGSFSA
ncbi:helix-turn-helix domain-containing protein [Chitinophaga nivalis]|uniref:Helix-turn-helix transcriptional regulator n=1 Tax=Chitinophaga nivalis TaxID=2991709 RepID=A0ABT3IH73_9BACT|nr:helix-turn-helix transcriptional regulator [Chitinophaga nivalis]MCW3467194.1 helix-turn-helix transcriptional regulator [Chitinophaga nivalis]MCW3483114.1 helix-turn-helix transcriptional regulator [Chitinophaga nivalis]